MKTKWMLLTSLFAVALLFFAAPAIAQDGIATEALERVADAGTVLSADTPTAENVPWQIGLITVLTPLIVAGIKLLIPKIPKVALPWIAPAVGVLLDMLSHYTLGADMNVWLAAGAGLAGVGLRELADQSKKAADAKLEEELAK